MSLALYRKYRPASFAEVVGQEHVTDPLRTALAAGRINHAYLFSGPRGCGKTSSARILARSLNCVQGPTPDPCGVCGSCVALAPEGPGSLDVVELDAASHGGVDDTRELRDRAFYMPAESRYRVFIIDEAHMVTPQGFNALLKIVEEPPEHLVFIFATTEPDKVLTTIRSRTHHYPFRLIPPAVLRTLLERLCAEEGVTVAPAVFPLVIQAGGGSARDSLSVLDQLLAGAGPDGVTYRSAVALLGVTDTALLDEMVDALAAADGASVFGAVDRVVEAGHDPRRFAADLLQRLRDLLVLHAVPDAGVKGLIACPEDELTAMAGQAERLGPGTLARIADILHTGLVDMRGTTAPRLVLELLCARMLLPDTSAADGALLHRLERMERRMAIADTAAPANGTGLAPHTAIAPGAAAQGAQGDPGADAGARGSARPTSSGSATASGKERAAAPAATLPAPPPRRTAGLGVARPPGSADDRRASGPADPNPADPSAAGSTGADAPHRPANGQDTPAANTATPPGAPHPAPVPPPSPSRVPDGPGAVPSLGLPVPPVLASRRSARPETGTQAAPRPPVGDGSAASPEPAGQTGRTVPGEADPAGGAEQRGRPAASGEQATSGRPARPPASARPVAGPPSSARPAAGRTAERPSGQDPTGQGPAAPDPASRRPVAQDNIEKGSTARPSAPDGNAQGSSGTASSGTGGGDPPPSTALDAAGIRKLWPEILAAVKRRRRTTQILLDSATVRTVERGVLMLTMPSPGMARRVLETANVTILREALVEVAGVDWAVSCDAGGDSGAGGGRGTAGGGGGLGAGPGPGGSGGARREPPFPDGDVPPPTDADAPVDEADDIPDDYDEQHDARASVPVREPVAAAIELLAMELGARRLEPPPA